MPRIIDDLTRKLLHFGCAGAALRTHNMRRSMGQNAGGRSLTCLKCYAKTASSMPSSSIICASLRRRTPPSALRPNISPHPPSSAFWMM